MNDDHDIPAADPPPPAPPEVPVNPDLATRTTPPADHGFPPPSTPFSALVAPTLAIIEQAVARRELDGSLERERVEEAKRIQLEIDRRISLHCARDIPLKAARVLVTGVRATRAIGLVMKFMEGEPGTIVLSGGVGTGKSVAASWAVSGRVRERYFGSHPDGHDGTWPADYHPRFVDVAILSRLPRLPSFAKVDANSVWLPFMKCSVLAIDDVGMEPDKGFAAILDGLIVHRHDNETRTVITTNMDAKRFSSAYGERVCDRIRSTGGYWELDEESMRGEAP